MANENEILEGVYGSYKISPYYKEGALMTLDVTYVGKNSGYKVCQWSFNQRKDGSIGAVGRWAGTWSDRPISDVPKGLLKTIKSLLKCANQ